MEFYQAYLNAYASEHIDAAIENINKLSKKEDKQALLEAIDELRKLVFEDLFKDETKE